MKWRTYRVFGFLSFAFAIVVIPFCWEEVLRAARGRYVFIAPFLLPSILGTCLGYYLMQKARLTRLSEAFAVFRKNAHNRTPQERLAFYKTHAASMGGDVDLRCSYIELLIEAEEFSVAHAELKKNLKLDPFHERTLALKKAIPGLRGT